MRQFTLGDSGVRVSEFCLGAMYFGTRNDKAEFFPLLDQFMAAGRNFIDTANIYAHWVKGGKGGESETIWAPGCMPGATVSSASSPQQLGSSIPGSSPGCGRIKIKPVVRPKASIN